MTTRTRRVLRRYCVLLGLAAVYFLFAAAASYKLFRWSDYASVASIMVRRVVPDGMTAAIVMSVPFAEAGAAILVVFRRTRAVGLILMASLLVGFTAALVHAAVSDPVPRCACIWPALQAATTPGAIGRNLLMLALVAWLARACRSDTQTTSPSTVATSGDRESP